MKNAQIVQYLASDAVRWQEEKYVLQQQFNSRNCCFNFPVPLHPLGRYLKICAIYLFWSYLFLIEQRNNYALCHLFTAQDQPNACDSEPCQNGGTCELESFRSIFLRGSRLYRCSCPISFTGYQCQIGKLFAYCNYYLLASAAVRVL